MIIQYSLYSIMLLISAIISCILAVYVWKRREAPGGIYFSLMMAAAAEWALFNALEMAATDLLVKVWLYDLLYIGVVSVAPLWFMFALEFSKRSQWITNRRKVLLWVIPVAILLLALTNPLHGLVWSGITPVTDMLGTRFVYEHAIGDWIIGAYSYVLLMSGTIMLVMTALRSPKSYRGQIGTLIIGTGAPWIGNLIYLADISPFPGLDLTPFALTITGILFAWGMFRHHLFDIMPVARETLITNMVDGVLVLDDQNRIVDINPAARQLTGARGRVIGLPAEVTLTKWPDLERYCKDREDRSVEVRLDGDEETRWLDAHITPLHDRKEQGTGLLIILRDVTERKRAAEALQQAYDELIRSNSALQAEVVERKKAEGQIMASLIEKEVLLKEIHHRVKNNLQIISSLLNLQSGTLSRESAAAFKESQSRIKSMALIHEMLYRSQDLARIDFADYVRSLTAFLARSYTTKPGTHITIDILDISLDIDTAIPCGLIINELVSNSLKYAFNDRPTGEIKVSLSYADGIYTLIVSDNGTGLPPGTDYRNTASLGLQLVNTLVDQIEGSIRLEPGTGTTFMITFKENTNSQMSKSG